MSLLTIAQEGQLAEEVVRTVLQGALSRQGSQKAFATHAGISSIHVNYIIHERRMPKLQTAERMARHLPLTTDERTAWLHYVLAYWEAHKAIDRHLPVTVREDFASLADEIWQARIRAVTTADPNAAHLLYRSLAQLSEHIQHFTLPPVHFTRYLQVLDVFQEVSATLGRRPDALWAARRMQWVAETMEPEARREDLIQVHTHRLNAIRTEAVALNNLHLHDKAYSNLARLESDSMYPHFQPWSPTVMWDKMNALAHMRRSSLREARQIWHAGLDIAAQNAEDWTDLCQMLLTRSYAEVAISHGRFEEAKRVLDAYRLRRDKIIAFGAFYQALFDMTYARLLWEQPRRDWSEWRDVISRAYATAIHAGFAQQLWEMQQAYGDSLHAAFAA